MASSSSFDPFVNLKDRRRYNSYFIAISIIIFISLPLTYFLVLRNTKIASESVSFTPNLVLSEYDTKVNPYTINSTLGFQKIYYMELPHRNDRMSVMALQAGVLNITYETLDAFNAEPYKANGYVGMVPTKNAWNGGFMGTSHYGCYQAHVNALRKVIEDNVETALILEGDIAFDINIKRILTEALPNLDMSFKIHAREHIKKGEAYKIDRNDPYQSKKWDMFVLTSCADMKIDEHEDVIYDDELSLGGGTIVTPAGKRRVGRTGGPTCTGGYAVSRAGATKLLTLLSLDSSMPIDLTIKDIVAKRLLTGYTINPSVAGTWVYKSGLGLDGRQSTINADKKEYNDSDKNKIESAWKRVKSESLSIWEMNYPKNLNSVLKNIRKYVLLNPPYNGLNF